MTLASILSTIFFMTSNRKALGFFKDELNSVPMREFFALCLACYAFLCTGNVDKNILQHNKPVEKKTAKGVKRKVKDYHLHFARYLDVLRSQIRPIVFQPST